MTTVKALSVTVRVTGGRKFKRFIATGEKRLGARFARRFVKSFPLALYRADLPKKTGKLRRSIRLVQRGGTVELRGVGYGKQVRWRLPGRQRRTATVANTWFRRAQQTVRRGFF